MDLQKAKILELVITGANGIEHMQILAIDKNKNPCYDLLRADLVGSQEQLEMLAKKMKFVLLKH